MAGGSEEFFEQVKRCYERWDRAARPRHRALALAPLNGLLAGYSAAGRDKAAHGPDADRFDVTRPARRTAARHLSLGHGPHYCLGATLARMEATVALEQLFGRFPELELAVPETALPHHPRFVGNSTGLLPVRLRP